MHTVLHWDDTAESLAASSQSTHTSLHPELIFAKDSIDGINNGSPIRPDIGRPGIQEYWQEKQQQRQHKKPAAKKQQQKDKRPSLHQIDDYA